MKKLKPSIIKGKVPPAKSLSMDDYLRFVNMHLKYTLDRKTAREWKASSAVKVPFII